MNSRRLPPELTVPAIALLLVLIFLVWPGRPGAEPADEFAGFRPPAMSSLRINLSKKSLWRLRLKREQALRRGILISADDDWVNATLHEGKSSWPVSIRLKGDWTDHLEGGKWSFRVRMRRGTCYRGMSVFSLQNPETRNFLSEWLFHRVLREEGVLSPRYDFVRLSVNGSDLGIYALEEHFTKQMLESQGRREGPLLKFNENGMWEARVEALRDPRFPYMELPIYDAAQPEAFQASRYLKSDSAKRVMETALNLMHQYKHGLVTAAEIFDTKLAARQYALTDLFLGHHSLVWHNRRFAYNPIISRLEPVVYDAYAGEMSGMYLNGPFTGYGSNGNTSYGRREDLLGTLFFRDDEFVEEYYRCLWRFSDPQYPKMLRAEHEGNWMKRQRFIRREFPGYEFDFGAIERQADEIRRSMKGMRWRDLKMEETGNNLVCLQNYTPFALVVQVKSSGEKKLLGAYDGVSGACWAEMEWEAVDEVRFSVAGKPGDDEKYTITRPLAPR